jgi:hypothetical protein
VIVGENGILLKKGFNSLKFLENPRLPSPKETFESLQQSVGKRESQPKVHVQQLEKGFSAEIVNCKFRLEPKIITSLKTEAWLLRRHLSSFP